MKTSHKLFFLLNSFSAGLIVPVLSLVLLSHGATLETLSLCVGIISTIVVVMELPSGILTDIYGRKRIFLLSHVFILISFIFIIISREFILLAIACFFQGLGKAFYSGTVEIMEIESYMLENGSNGLSKINSELAIIECIGLALGSLCGGAIGYGNPSYTILLLICICMEIVIVILAEFLIIEKPERKIGIRLVEQLKNLVNSLRTKLTDCDMIKALLAASTLLGIGVCVVEIYWQPALKSFLPQNLYWMFGVINCLGYLGVIMGNKGAELLWKFLSLSKNTRRSIKFYCPLRLTLSVLIMILGFCTTTAAFIIVYILIYVILGAGNLFENTLFHSSIENDNRSSMLSLSSLFLRSGGIITSVLGSLILTNANLLSVWLMLPFIMFIGTALVGLFYANSKSL